ncbi:hypothetical protein DPMN_113595 [Dreissena polymorpha]|uniref:Uncharacterized protein n=1 Tax=Dreissena polymorpha TaxID=45954 RepID=A0A9D4QQT8_DREPO|nr:hypothetical protein DPMN_113595 [Dreissena polymorpha]
MLATNHSLSPHLCQGERNVHTVTIFSTPREGTGTVRLERGTERFKQLLVLRG